MAALRGATMPAITARQAYLPLKLTFPKVFVIRKIALYLKYENKRRNKFIIKKHVV